MRRTTEDGEGTSVIEKAEIQKEIQQSAEDSARRIRELLAFRKVFAVNLISTPGSGKTTRFEALCERKIG